MTGETRQDSPSRLAKAIAIVIGGACLLLTARESIVPTLRSRQPELALRLDPSDAKAKASLAAALIKSSGRNSDYDRIERLASEALLADATLASAASALAGARDATGRTQSAARLMRYSSQLSRRDLLTQLWLGEAAVKRNDADGALDHYDIALRTSPAGVAIIIPVLVGATEDTGLIPAFVRALAKRPPWTNDFLLSAINSGKDSSALGELIIALRRARVPVATDVSNALLSRLIKDNRFDVARRVFSTVSGQRVGGVRNGGFESDGDGTPFDWALASEPSIYAQRGPIADRAGYGLRFHGDSGAGGVAASQLLMLSPGAHRLATRVFEISQPRGSRPFLRLACAGPDGALLGQLDLPNAGEDGAAVAGVFVVPANCSAQWLTLELRASDEMGGVNGALDDVRIDAGVQMRGPNQATR